MKDRAVLSGLLFVLCAVLVNISCGSKSPASNLLSPRRGAAHSAANDYTKPYLTDEKMTKFIDSMKEEHNPLGIIFKQGGQVRNPLDVAGRMQEFNAFAQKYGFRDYEDYTAVWGRIITGETQLWAADMQSGAEASLQKSISDAQEQLKKPDLSPEMRKIYQDQVTSTQQALENMKNEQSKSALNDADMALVKKYKDQIDESQKKYQSANH